MLYHSRKSWQQTVSESSFPNKKVCRAFILLHPEAAATQLGKHHLVLFHFFDGARDLIMFTFQIGNLKSQFHNGASGRNEATGAPKRSLIYLLKEHLNSLVDLNKDLESIMELQMSLMKRLGPAIQQKLQVRETLRWTLLC